MIFRKYITAKELAAYLSVKVKTVYSWVEAGKIPAYKINGALRFNLKEINAFIKEQRIQTIDVKREARKIIGNKIRKSHNFPDSGQKTPR